MGDWFKGDELKGDELKGDEFKRDEFKRDEFRGYGIKRDEFKKNKCKKLLAILLTLTIVALSLPVAPNIVLAATTADSSSLFTFDTNSGAIYYNVNLTSAGDLDWFQLSQNSETNYAKKLNGSGLFGFRRDRTATPTGALEEVLDGRMNFSASDADPVGAAVRSQHGLSVRGVGNYLEFKVATSSQPRLIQAYMGNWNAQARIDYIVDGTVKFTQTFSNSNHNSVYVATIYVEPNTEGTFRQTLTNATSYGASSGSTFLFAATLSDMFSLDKYNLALKIGESSKITAIPSDSSGGISWSSSDPLTASVDQDGGVEGLKIGDAVISAELNGVTKQCAVKVISEDAEIVAGGYLIDMSDLPKVHFADHPEWEEVYDATWNMHKSNIKKISSAINPDAPYYIDEAFNEKIFVWDTMFMMMFDKWGQNQFPTLASIDNFYYNQTDHEGFEDDGYICKEFEESGGFATWIASPAYKDVRAINPPIFSWAEWEQYTIHGDKTRFEKPIEGKLPDGWTNSGVTLSIYERLKKFYNFVETYQKMPSGLYGKTNGWGNGLDNTYNQGSPYDGGNQASSGDQSFNDLSIQHAQDAYYIAKIADVLGYAADKAFYESEHARVSALIIEKMWDEDEKMFSNLDRDGVTHTNVSTPTTLWALAGRVATTAQADDLVNYHGHNSNRLFRPFGLATADYTDTRHTYYPEGAYWRGSYWAPTSFQYIKGLSEYGYDNLAFEEALRHLESANTVYKATRTVWENYSADFEKQGSSSRSNFAGWTGCMTIGNIMDEMIGLRMDAPNNTIGWNIRLTEEHGVSNLWFKNNGMVNRVSLLANARTSADDPVTFKVTAERAFTLKVRNNNGVEQIINVDAGTSTHTVSGAGGENGGAPILDMYVGAYSAAGLSAATLTEADDYVTFSASVNATVTDGIRNQIRKGTGLIKNVNTVGESWVVVAPTYRDNLQMQALNVSGAREITRGTSTKGRQGFMFELPADSKAKTATVIVGITNGEAEIRAELMDASATRISEILTGGASEAVYAVEIPYRAAGDGHNAIIKILHNATSGSAVIALKGIILKEGVRSAAPINFSLTPLNGAIRVNANPPVGTVYDSWNVYYGSAPGSLSSTLTSASMPFIIDNLTNMQKCYVAVAGVIDSIESFPTATLVEIPEEHPLSGEDRALADIDAALTVMLSKAIGDVITDSFTPVVNGPIYGSLISLSSDSDGQAPGLWNNGLVRRSALIGKPVTLTVTADYNGSLASKTIELFIPAIDIENDGYVINTTPSRFAGSVYLTRDGLNDWRQYNISGVATTPARKTGGSGIGALSVNRTAVPSGWVGRMGDVPDNAYVYSDAASGAQPANSTGFAVAGDGNYLDLELAYNDKPQRADIYFGAYYAKVRISFLVNGVVAVSEEIGEDGFYGVYRVGFNFKLADPNDIATVRILQLDGDNYGKPGAGDVFINAVTLRDGSPLHYIPRVFTPDYESTPLVTSSTSAITSSTSNRINLSAVGSLDWFQLSKGEGAQWSQAQADYSLANYAKKLNGQGIGAVVRNHPNAGDRIAVDDAPIYYSVDAGDRDPDRLDITDRFGILSRGVGNALEFTLTPSDNPRLLRVYHGAYSAGSSIALIKNGSALYTGQASASNNSHSIFCSTIYVAPFSSDDEEIVRLTLTSTTNGSGSSYLCAAALEAVETPPDYGVKIQAELFAHKNATPNPFIEECLLGGKDIGSIDANSWLTYYVDVEKGGLYELAAEYASQSQTNPGLTILLDGDPIGSINSYDAPGTSQSWDFRIINVFLKEGAHELKLSYANAGTKLRSLSFKYQESDISIDDRIVIEPTSIPSSSSEAFNPAFSVTAKADVTLTLYAASYDGNGRLVQVSSSTAELRSGDTCELSTSVAKEDGYTYKFFLWDGAFVPLTRIITADEALSSFWVFPN